MSPRRLCRPACLAVPALFAWALGASAEGSGVVEIKEQGNRLAITVNGEPFSEYHFSGGSRPFLYPILLPGGVPMTRNWPMKEAPSEERDHPHHQSLWWAHGEINGVDFWSESTGAGKTLQTKLLECKSGHEGIIRTENQLRAPDGKVVATDERTIRIAPAANNGRIVDFAVTVHASQGDLEFGDTKEGTMAVRLNEALRLSPNKENQGKPTGHIVNSEGVRDGETWGKRAKWVDYFGAVGGRTVGVAIFDHPKNPRHPTWWHVRDYGLFAANPFGIHDFEKKPPGTGKFLLPKNETVTFRYRFYFHSGDSQEAGVAKHYSDYATESASP